MFIFLGERRKGGSEPARAPYIILNIAQQHACSFKEINIKRIK